MRRKNFTIRRQRAALECPTFPFNPREFRAPDMLCRDSGLPLNTRNSMGTSGNVFEDLPAPEGSSPLFFKIPRNLTSSPFELRSGNTGSTMRHGEGLRREPQSSTRPTPRFTRNLNAWNPMHRIGGTYSQNCMMEAPKFAFSELHFGTFQDFR